MLFAQEYRITMPTSPFFKRLSVTSLNVQNFVDGIFMVFIIFTDFSAFMTLYTTIVTLLDVIETTKH